MGQRRLGHVFRNADVSNSKGWAKIGQPNVHQMRMFSQYLGRRPADSLTTLIADSSRFQKIESVQDAYAESWALTYFLMKDQPAAFAEYMKEIGKLTPLSESTSRERVGRMTKALRRFGKARSAIREDHSPHDAVAGSGEELLSHSWQPECSAIAMLAISGLSICIDPAGFTDRIGFNGR
ncbi:MAG: DUF1570 domain-containing protein [Pirellulales bacterium]